MKVALFFECTEVGIQLPCKGYVGYTSQEALESFASPDYFRGNRILLNNSIIRMAAKSPFCLPSILLPEAMDQSETPLRLMLRPPSIYQGPICQA